MAAGMSASLALTSVLGLPPESSGARLDNSDRIGITSSSTPVNAPPRFIPSNALGYSPSYALPTTPREPLTPGANPNPHPQPAYNSPQSFAPPPSTARLNIYQNQLRRQYNQAIGFGTDVYNNIPGVGSIVAASGYGGGVPSSFGQAPNTPYQTPPSPYTGHLLTPPISPNNSLVLGGGVGGGVGGPSSRSLTGSELLQQTQATMFGARNSGGRPSGGKGLAASAMTPHGSPGHAPLQISPPTTPSDPLSLAASTVPPASGMPPAHSRGRLGMPLGDMSRGAAYGPGVGVGEHMRQQTYWQQQQQPPQQQQQKGPEHMHPSLQQQSHQPHHVQQQQQPVQESAAATAAAAASKAIAVKRSAPPPPRRVEEPPAATAASADRSGKKQACTVCHHAKTSCDGRRPCFRCVRLNKTALCHDRTRKEHLKKKGGRGGSAAGRDDARKKKKGSAAANKRKRARGTDSDDAADEDVQSDAGEGEDDDNEAQSSDPDEEEEEEEGVPPPHAVAPVHPSAGPNGSMSRVASANSLYPSPPPPAPMPVPQSPDMYNISTAASLQLARTGDQRNQLIPDSTLMMPGLARGDSLGSTVTGGYNLGISSGVSVGAGSLVMSGGLGGMHPLANPLSPLNPYSPSSVVGSTAPEPLDVLTFSAVNTPRDEPTPVGAAAGTILEASTSQLLSAQRHAAQLPPRVPTTPNRDLAGGMLVSPNGGHFSSGTSPGGMGVSSSSKDSYVRALMTVYQKTDLRSKLKASLEAHKLNLGRVQFYLVNLAELLEEEDFNEFAADLPLPVFSAARTHLGPRVKLLTPGANESTSPSTTSSASPMRAGQARVTWNLSPLRCMDEESQTPRRTGGALMGADAPLTPLSVPGSIAPGSSALALMKLQPVQASVAQRAHSLAERRAARAGRKAARAERKRVRAEKKAARKARRKERRARKKEARRVKRAKKKAKEDAKAAAGAAPTATDEEPSAKRAKLDDGSAVAAAPASATVDGVDSDSDASDSSSSSESSSSESESSESEEDLDEDVVGSQPVSPGPDGLPTARLNHHEPSCRFYTRGRRYNKVDPITPGDNNAAGNSPATCGCVPALDIPMIVSVNREWERLFGYTQSELRTLLMKEGFRGLTRLTRLDSLQASHRLTVEAMLNGVTDYRFYAVIINKWLAEINCLVHTRAQLNETDNSFQGFIHTWMPLPDPRPPPCKPIL